MILYKIWHSVVAQPSSGDHDLNILNLHYPRSLPHKFHLFRPNKLCKDLRKILKNFQYFKIITPSKRTWPYHLNKPESLLLNNALCQTCLKLALCFWRRRRKCEKCTTTTMKTTCLPTTDNGQMLTEKPQAKKEHRNFTWQYYIWVIKLQYQLTSNVTDIYTDFVIVHNN